MNAVEKTISVIFPHIETLKKYYVSEKSIQKAPSDSFPITVDEKGNTVSLYGDINWDLSNYLANKKQKKIIKFEKIKDNNLIKEAKLLMFYIMVYGREKRGGLYSASYLVTNYFNSCLYPLAVFAISNNIEIKDVLSQSHFLKKYIREFIGSRPQLIRPLSIIIELFNKIKGFKEYHIDNYIEINKFISQFKEKNLFIEKTNMGQTAVIPSSIFNKTLLERWEHIDFFEKDLDSLCKLIEKLVITKFYGISPTQSTRFSVNEKGNPNFVIWDCNFYKNHGLEDFFERYSSYYYHGRADFRRIILDFQGTCKQLIHAYSGMRSEEAISLKSNCIEAYRDGDTQITKLIGITTKLEGQTKTVKWVTTENIERVVNILVAINKTIYCNQNVDFLEMSLFAPTFPIYSPKKYSDIARGSSDITNRELFLSKESKTITEQDIKELEEIDYFKDWRNDKKFAVGSQWEFKSHQYRRSLAVYSIQSGLVSLGGLQIQLKHLFREMTLYYGRGASQADRLFKSNGLGKEISQIKPEIEALAYIKNVIFSDEHLYGNHGKDVEKNIKQGLNENFLISNRKSIISKFQNGEMSYKETPLGGCTSIEICDSKLTRSITACFECKSGVLKDSKLSNVIGKQKEFIAYLDKDSVEYRSELKDLETLEKYKNKLTKENNE